MTEFSPKTEIFFTSFVTKGMVVADEGRRIFEGYLTVQVVDKQNEITVVEELMKVMPIWKKRGAPVSDSHSNRIIGQGLEYEQRVFKDANNGEEYPAIWIKAEIFKDYELDNIIWDRIKTKEYKGLSFGGATKSHKIPQIQKDGRIAFALKDLEQYEVAVCKDPACNLALITRHNELAKAMTDSYTDRGEDMCIQCDKFGCIVTKSNELNQDTPPSKGAAASEEAAGSNTTKKLEDTVSGGDAGGEKKERELIKDNSNQKTRGKTLNVDQGTIGLEQEEKAELVQQTSLGNNNPGYQGVSMNGSYVDDTPEGLGGASPREGKKISEQKHKSIMEILERINTHI